jgi:sulfur-oxidizing protein SoxY
MNLLRRKFLKTATFVGGAVVIGGSVLAPRRAIAAYAQAAFEAKDVSGALSASLGSDQHSASDAVKLKAPDIAENGAVVPITVSADMSNVSGISIIAEGPAADFDLPALFFQRGLRFHAGQDGQDVERHRGGQGGR